MKSAWTMGRRLLFVCCLASGACTSASPELFEDPELDGIQETLSTYVQGFATADVACLERALSEEFFRSTGGEGDWRTTLSALQPRYQDARLGRVEFREGAGASDSTRWVRFSIVAGSQAVSDLGESWFHLERSHSGEWRIAGQRLDEGDPGP